MKPTEIGLNILQIFLPLICLGDFATDLWFIVDLALSIPTSKNAVIVGWIVIASGLVLLGKMIVGMYKGCCCWMDYYLLPSRFWIKLGYHLCHVFNCFGFFMFLYQRCLALGPRYKQFQKQCEWKQNKPGISLTYFIISLFILICQFFGIIFSENPNGFNYFNITLTTLVTIYYIVIYCRNAWINNTQLHQQDKKWCLDFYQEYREFGEVVQAKLCWCFPRREFGELYANEQIARDCRENGGRLKLLVMENYKKYIKQQQNQQNQQKNLTSQQKYKENPLQLTLSQQIISNNPQSTTN